MTSAGPGPGTSRVEISGLSADGFRLRLGEEELTVAFADFPWFRKATVEQLAHIEWPSPDHLYWPSLDIDLAVESIRRPERFPRVSRELGRG